MRRVAPVLYIFAHLSGLINDSWICLSAFPISLLERAAWAEAPEESLASHRYVVAKKYLMVFSDDCEYFLLISHGNSSGILRVSSNAASETVSINVSHSH